MRFYLREQWRTGLRTFFSGDTLTEKLVDPRLSLIVRNTQVELNVKIFWYICNTK